MKLNAGPLAGVFSITAGLFCLIAATATSLHAQTNVVSGKCCADQYELHPQTPAGAVCAGNAPNCTGNGCNGTIKGTAVDAACTGQNAAANCTAASLQAGAQVALNNYTYKCGAGQAAGAACSCGSTSAFANNAPVKKCISDKCP